MAKSLLGYPRAEVHPPSNAVAGVIPASQHLLRCFPGFQNEPEETISNQADFTLQEKTSHPWVVLWEERTEGHSLDHQCAMEIGQFSVTHYRAPEDKLRSRTCCMVTSDSRPGWDAPGCSLQLELPAAAELP